MKAGWLPKVVKSSTKALVDQGTFEDKEADEQLSKAAGRRRTVQVSCISCRLSKVKCEGNLPCRRCIYRGIADSCYHARGRVRERDPELEQAERWANEDPETIERPIRYARDPFVYRPRLDADSIEAPTLLRSLCFDFGVSEKKAEDIFKVMPPRLKNIIWTGFTALEQLKQLEAMKLAQVNPPPVLPPGPSQLIGLKSWHHSARCGYRTIAVDPVTERWMTCDVNQWLADLAGVHREELCNRIANQDMVMPSSELRQLCAHLTAIFDQMDVKSKHGFQDGTKTYWYCRWGKNFLREPEGEGVIVRSCFTVNVNELGKFSGGTHTMVVVTEDEYDRVAEKSPDECEALAAAVVGRKSARELISKDLMRDEKIEVMAETEFGCRQLDRLAEILEKKFAPVIAIANQILPLPPSAACTAFSSWGSDDGV
ncbi:hypothetical protein GUITHDRAFT_108753 [Guillardia theta CCMP2712]|uniref:Zn(2)-C6 fungal-type domain-containing protein n=2 Tax=Guillardia theta TaxID=55529 RepID=L1JBI9_GUITC|nr:hypothetical protein GUITHDRAFT_108753 [Guillardia theta CCMP2712]EKX45489.1 hypothetical protein GUITHDRAFT_108753 [Guillardia theta CCMP2712]|eukprot:XP_005832469.1 hypothetical protein GUITHDRAFT_108753 [Guillardia theta CCMP2712]